jgi:hypothetical protein
MPDSNDYNISPERERLNEILTRVLAYQHTLSDGRAVELDELRRENVLPPDDIEFLNSHSVTYKPHRLSDHHALDMFRMPLAEGGCVFLGPSGLPLVKHRAALRNFRPVVENFLRLPLPQDELLLHIEFTERDGMAVAPEMIMFNFAGIQCREMLPAVRAVAMQLGLSPLQDEVVQESHILTYRNCLDAVHTAAATVTLMSRGCGFADETEVVYSAGALDEGSQLDAGDPAR